MEVHKVDKSLRLLQFLENWLIGGDEVTSLNLRSPFTPQEDFWRSYLLEAASRPGPV
jgi:hypothetical protein